MKRNHAILVVVLVVSLCSAVWSAGYATQTVGSSKYDDPLKYAQLIVRGVVDDIKFETITLEEWGVHTRHSATTPFDIATITLTASEVLKGTRDVGTMDIVLNRGANGHGAIGRGALGRIQIGDEVILCAHYWKYRGGSYALRNLRDSFVLRDGLWVRQSDDKGLTISEIRGTIAKTALPSVVRNSDLIVRGRVISMETSTAAQGAQGFLTTTATWTLSVLEILKGQTQAKEINFDMIISGASPEWRTRIPFDLLKKETAIGEELIVFLKRDGSGWIPFAGTNGIFQVRENKLIMDSHLVLPRSPQLFKEEVVREASND